MRPKRKLIAVAKTPNAIGWSTIHAPLSAGLNVHYLTNPRLLQPQKTMRCFWLRVHRPPDAQLRRLRQSSSRTTLWPGPGLTLRLTGDPIHAPMYANSPQLGNLIKDFNFKQTPRKPLILPVHPKTDLIAPSSAPVRGSAHGLGWG